MQAINKEDGKQDDRDDQEIPGYDGLGCELTNERQVGTINGLIPFSPAVKFNWFEMTQHETVEVAPNNFCIPGITQQVNGSSIVI